MYLHLAGICGTDVCVSGLYGSWVSSYKVDDCLSRQLLSWISLLSFPKVCLNSPFCFVSPGLYQDLSGRRPTAAKDYAHGTYTVYASLTRPLVLLLSRSLFIIFTMCVSVSPGHSRGQ